MTGAGAPARPAVGMAAAAAGWLAVVVVMNLTSQPVVVACAFAGGAVLALRTRQTRLLVISLVAGLGMLALVPGVAVVDGSLGVAYASWERPTGALDWLLAGLTTLRVPAQILAVGLLVLVPGELLLASVARRAPRAALLAGLAARLRPLLARDATDVRVTLEMSGMSLDAGRPGARIRAALALWDGVASGMFDRAAATAAALRTRGFGAAERPTTDALEHPWLRDGRPRSVVGDRLVVVCAAASVALVVSARATGGLLPASTQFLGGYGEPATVLAGVAGMFVGLLLVAPVVIRRSAPPRAPVRPERPGPHVRSAEPGDALEVRGLGLRYPGTPHWTLKGVDLDVQPGELVVVTGASGSGKSTLLDAVSGVAPVVSGGTRIGSIRLGHQVLRGAAEEAGLVAAVFQQPEAQVLIGPVVEEIAFGPRHAACSAAEVEQRVLEAMAAVGIEHLAGRDCATLSGGELQRVVLAAALALRPRLLVLDEPTAQLDAAHASSFWEAVDEVRTRAGTAVLVAEHRVEHVLARADRVLELCNDGTLREASELAVQPSPFGELERAAPGHGTRLEVRIPRITSEDGARVLLRQLQFTLPPGGLLAITGGNGSGKSTVLRAVRGLHGTDADVRLDGRVLGDRRRSARFVAYLGQRGSSTIVGCTVASAATVVSERLGISPVHALAALAPAGLAGRAHVHPTELSVGERQRLAVIAATSHGAPIWLLDEPTRGMDARARRWFALRVVTHLARGGVVIAATHDLDLVRALATHQLALDARTGGVISSVSPTTHRAEHAHAAPEHAHAAPEHAQAAPEHAHDRGRRS